MIFKPEYAVLKPFKNYVTLHFRLGDRFFKEKMEKTMIVDLIQTIVYPFLNKYKLFICSDSYDFLNGCKRYFSGYTNVLISNSIPVHTGNLKLTKNYHCQTYIDTLNDFQICSKSDKIITFSVYSWISGFVHWTSEIYDIPVESYELSI